MVRRGAGLGMVLLAVVVSLLLAARLLAAPGSGGSSAEQPTPFANLIPPGVEITPGPTATQIPGPTGTPAIHSAQALALALKGLGGEPDTNTASVRLEIAGNLTLAGPFKQWSPDYPVWVVHMRGSFHGSRDTNAGRRFASATVYVDGANGSVLGLSLTDEIVPTATPTS